MRLSRLIHPRMFRNPALGWPLRPNASPHRLHLEPLEDRRLLSAGPWTEQAKLTAGDDAAPYDHFGYSAAISGDTIVVGADGDDDSGSNSGSAYVFVRDQTGSWTQQAKLAAEDAAAGDAFGLWTVSISGDTIVVGARYDDDNGSNSGSAYVFVRDETGSWTQQAKLTAEDAAASDRFGLAVAISGDTIAVGASGDDTYSGSAYVFAREGTAWSQQAKLTADDPTSHEQFGLALATSGDTIVVGAGREDNDAGSAYVFVRDETNDWSQQARLTASDATADDFFGRWGVSISGETIVAGAQHNGGSGSAYVFVRSETSWTEQAKLTASDAAAGDYFGQSVSISGDTIVVGAEGDDDWSGSAYVFQRSGTTWIEQAKLTASDAAPDDSFGWPVSIAENSIVVGGGYNDDAGADSGSAYVFTLDPAASIDVLTDTVFELDLNQGTENSLESKLDSALGALADDNLHNDVAAINSLHAFINAVEAQRGNKITEENADNLIAAALATIDLLEEATEALV